MPSAARCSARQLAVGLVVGPLKLITEVGGVASDQRVAELVLVGVVAVEHERHVVPLVEQGAHRLFVTGVGAPGLGRHPGHGEAQRLVDLAVQIPGSVAAVMAGSWTSRCLERVQARVCLAS